MREIGLSDIEDSEMVRLKDSRPVILLGSHISTYLRTNLPSGEQISKSEEEFERLLEKVDEYVRSKLGPNLFPAVEKIREDPKFPKKAKTQIAFFADSLAGLGQISPRRSRDICAEGRKKKHHTIIRQDYYIECTCGYEGPAKHGACPCDVM